MRQLPVAIGAACLLSAALLYLAPKRPAAPLELLLATDAESPVLRALEFAHRVLPASIAAPYTAELLALGARLDRPLSPAEQQVQRAVAQDAPAPAPAAWATARPFEFIPRFQGRVLAAAETWSSECWTTVTAKVVPVKKSLLKSAGWDLEVTVAGARKAICSDAYLFTTASGFHLGTFPTPVGGTKKYHFTSKDLSPSEQWDVETLGVRVFHFNGGPTKMVHSLLETALLFAPLLTQAPTAAGSSRNLAFLKEYAGVDMPPRSDPGGVVLNASAIKSGDFLGVIRLDGLDPMLAWGMGARTGHTVVALWEDGELYICESTTSSKYWPTNGIQRTPYATWIEQARAAGYAAVHVPLRAELSANFDAAKANAFFHSQENLQYGFQNLLWGWIDTRKDNYPCLPHDPSTCLTWELIETVFPLLVKHKQLAEPVGLVFLETWNQQVVGDPFAGKSTTELYQLALQKGMNLADIPTVVASDATRYSQKWNNGTATTGRSLVCDVFVCEVWKAGGVFASIEDDFNCVEQMNNDIYNLEVLSPTKAPECAVQEANPLCQLVGEHTLTLPSVGTWKVYKHMHERCPTLPPNYTRPDGC